MSKQGNETFNVRIVRNSNKSVVKDYTLPFTSPFEAMEWGEKQVVEYGAGHSAELVTKAKKK